MKTRILGFFGLWVVLCLGNSVLAADFQVNQTGDAGDGTCDATCTLRDAVTAANGTAGNDSISFSYVVFNPGATINLTGAEMTLSTNGSITINGFDADKIVIDGNGTNRIFTVDATATAIIRNVSLTGGGGAGTANTGRGGAVYNNGGTLTLEDVYIFENTAANGGGLNTAGAGTTYIFNCEIANNTALTSSGGGLQNFSTSILNVYGTTFRGNTSNSSTGGGGIQGGGDITVTNSTFSGNNAAGGDGGGISYNGGSTRSLIVTNSTFTGNTAGDQGGAIRKSDTTNNGFIRNNIFTGNTSADSSDLFGNYASQGFNVVQTTATATGLTMDDVTGSSALLTPIGNYGGFSYTHALTTASPAIDLGDNCVVTANCATGNPPYAVSTDQRDALRPFASAVDSGSFEFVGTEFRARLDDGAVGVSYFEEITPNRGNFTYTITGGSLPPGLTLSNPNNTKTADGAGGPIAILGTPTMTGTYDFGILISDGTNLSTVFYRIVIAQTNLTGNILDPAGNPLSGVFVVLSDGMGGTQTTQTTLSGAFTFTNVNAGATYTVSVRNRRYNFRNENILLIPGTNRLNPIVQ